MIRRLFTALSALSLFLCLATTVLWVRSYWKGVGVSREECDSHTLSIGTSAVSIGDGRVRIFLRSMRFESRLAYDRWAPGNRVNVSVSTVPFQYRFRTALSHFAVRINSARRDGDEFAGMASRTNRVHQASPPASGKYVHRTREAIVPIGYVALLFFLLGLPAIYQIRRRLLAVRPGHCSVCGYDLRASTLCCPECGTPVPARQQSAASSS